MTREAVWTVEPLADNTYRFRFVPLRGAAVDIEIVSPKGGEPIASRAAIGVHESFEVRLAGGGYTLRCRLIGGSPPGIHDSQDFTVPFEGKCLHLGIAP